MSKSKVCWSFALALALAIPSFAKAYAANPKKTDDSASTAGMSKEDQEKMKEHVKLRNEIKKVKFPASKADIVAHVKGVKPDDKKWFSETLPDKTYTSADEVYSALGWETTPAPTK